MATPKHIRVATAIRAASRRQRRGTFIVLVVGMLALMTIIAVVYFSIGQADSRTAAAAKSASDRDEIPQLVGKYIAQVIADDVTATYTDPGSGSQIREAWDYPSTDPAVLSNPGAGNRFTARGMRGDDPFLASTEPTTLNPLAPGIPQGDTSQLFMYRRDWAHISNIAPDGNYVSLFNLRGDFNATPEDMRENLRVFNDSGALVPLASNSPAAYSTDQVHLFRPAVAAPGSSVNDANYLPYHFADADGDGFYDARWQELVDRIDANNPIDILPSDSKYRYVIAARVVDLSARVNVNTAMSMLDATSAPSNSIPYGSTPSDIDLRALLSMQDAYLMHGDGAGAMGIGTADYNIWNPSPTASVDNYGAITDVIARDVADAGFNALRLSLRASVIPEPRADLDNFAQKYIGASATGDQRSPIAGERRLWYLTAGGPSGTAATEDSVRLTGGFGLSSLQDLLTFGSVNDPAQLSLLESAIGGRFPDTPADPAQTRRYSPLRDNRGFLAERPTIAEPNTGDPAYQGMMLTFASDVRQRLTTLSSSRPIRPWANVPGTSGSLDTVTTTPTSVTDYAVDAQSLLSARNVNQLFRAYADLLAPYTDQAGVWDRAGGDFPQTRTLFYGYDGPELPVRVAAHMAANLQSMARPTDPESDEVDTPQPYTVILNESIRGQLETSLAAGDVASRTFDHAYRSDDLPLLDLGDGNLATTTDGIGTSVLTVYGNTPQPVLTGVATFAFYCDVPSNRGGDQEFEPPPFPGEPSPLKPITIRGGRDFAGNTDYLGTVIAFQITNPFDVEIRLDTSDVPSLRYYLEFGGNQYRLASFSPQAPADPPAAVSLPARSSRVFYVLDRSYTEINTRWISTATAFGALTEPIDANIFNRWIDQHLTVRENPNGVGDLAPVLIRAVDATTGALVGTPTEIFSTATPALNDVVNLWRLVSREELSDDNFVPVTGGTNSRVNDYLVDRLRVPVGTALDRTLPSGQQEVAGTIAGDESSSNKIDNTGYTLAVFNSVRRPAGGSAGSTGLPAFMIERKTTSGGSLNQAQNDGLTLTSLTKSNFGGSSDVAFTDFDDFLDDQASSDRRAVPFLSRNPQDWISALTLPGIGNNASGRPYSEVVPEYVRAALRQRFAEDTLRPADMLLPLGFGAWVEADESGNTDLNNNWTTLGEALALATDYAQSVGGFGVPTPPMNAIGSDSRVGGPALFRGNLLYRAFVPFRDLNANVAIDVDANGLPTETIYGLGVPPALRVLDTFHTLPPDYRSPTVATRGLININTASPDVLRAMRILSPSPVPADRDWWTSPGSGVGVYDATSDVAATLLSYRDRIPVLPRTLPMAPAIVQANLLDFSDENAAAYGGGNISGRTFATGISGINETRGFRSVGEILLASDLRSANFDVHAIDRFALDNTDLAQQGVDMRDDFGADGLIDEYSESIAIATSISGMVTVRSDTYAVWFVLHGYQRSDVAGLGPTDPMVPSVARRFLMIVDRSKVTSTGQEPEILLFQEVPYAEIPY